MYVNPLEIAPLLPNETRIDDNGWKGRHIAACRRGEPIAVLIISLYRMAQMHKERYEWALGTDHALGPEFESMIRSARFMLNGEIGFLDAGTCDAALCNLWTIAECRGNI